MLRIWTQLGPLTVCRGLSPTAFQRDESHGVSYLQIDTSWYVLPLGSAPFLVNTSLPDDSRLAIAQVLTSAPLAKCPRLGTESLFLPPLTGSSKSQSSEDVWALWFHMCHSLQMERRGCALVMPVQVCCRLHLYHPCWSTGDRGEEASEWQRRGSAFKSP